VKVEKLADAPSRFCLFDLDQVRSSDPGVCPLIWDDAVVAIVEFLEDPSPFCLSCLHHSPAFRTSPVTFCLLPF